MFVCLSYRTILNIVLVSRVATVSTKESPQQQLNIQQELKFLLTHGRVDSIFSRLETQN